jgi:hypothetical protein
MRHLKLNFQNENRFVQVWTWRQDGKDMPATFDLERKKCRPRALLAKFNFLLGWWARAALKTCLVFVISPD